MRSEVHVALPQRGHTVLATASTVVTIDPAEIPADAYRLREHTPAGTAFRDLGVWWRAVQPGIDAPWDLRAMTAQEVAGVVERAHVQAEAGAPRAERTLAAAENVLADDQLWEARRKAGFRVDATRARSLLQHQERERERWTAELGIDLTRDCSASVAWLRARGVAAKFEERKEGFPEVKVDATVDLTKLTATHPELAAWPVVEQLGKDLKVLRPLARHITRSGRIFPRINVNGATTGRMVTTEPNVQGVRKDLRRLILAEPGHVLISADHTSAELMMVADIVGDSRLTALATDPSRDFYEYIAALADVERKKAKVAFLAWLYGQQPRSMTKNITGDPRVTERLTRAFRSLPALAEWRDAQQETMARGERFATEYGRPLRQLPEGKHHAAANLRVQGSARDAFGLAVRAVESELGNAAMFLPIHDELIVQVPAADVPDAIEVLRERFGITLPNGTRIRTEPTVLGVNWAKK